MKSKAGWCIGATILMSCTNEVPAAPHGEDEVGSVTAALDSDTGALAAEATIYEDATGNNGGGYTEFCIGNKAVTTGTRRALIRYNLPLIPAGSQVERVEFTISQELVRSMGGPLGATMELRRVNDGAAWTEGGGSATTRSCGAGANVSGVDWAGAPGVSSTVSASQALGTGAAAFVLDSDNAGHAGLVADVQAWVDGDDNNGWEVRVNQEGTANNARSMRPGATITVEWLRGDGATCTQDSDCANHCVHSDGANCGGRSGCVCCDQATCLGTCQTCHRSGNEGTCGAAANTVPCRSASCSSGEETAAENCDGVNTSCPGPNTTPCAPYICGASACTNSCSDHGDCNANAYCSGGSCFTKKSQGQSCGSDVECSNDRCVDGYCCSSNCTGQCEACDVGGSLGTCSAVDGAPHGSRTACITDGSACGGSCNGILRSACTYPGGATECRSVSCSSQTQTNAAFCNGTGSCPSSTTTQCHPYQCGTSSCRTSCSVSGHCSATFECSGSTCQCPFGTSEFGGVCVLDNECTDGTNDCDVNASCMDLDPGWDCTCNSGYSGDGHTTGTGCTDINECSPVSPCGSGHRCQNTPGSYNCICLSGYRFQNGTCEDIDECVENPTICGPNSTSCRNRTGSYQCGCQPGYEAPTSGGSCTDINECLGTPCGPNGTGCDNQPGTYECSCAPGYEAPTSGGTCTDIDECTDTPGICGPGSCSDIDGSYQCRCNSGYRAPSQGGTCTNINECTDTPDICGPNGTDCTDTTGSYTCECADGYEATTGNPCEDIDECAGGDPCNEAINAGTCNNEDGTYTCDCNRGYEPRAGTCVDIDECAVNPCGNGLCQQADPGDYRCACNAGYEPDQPLNGTCIDIDECADCADPETCADPSLGPCPAHSFCTNEIGSHVCSCDAPQYAPRGGPTLECLDVDECEVGIDNCSPLAICTNNPGGFECECQEGYEGSGINCRDIDECGTDANGCDRATETCVNQPGVPNMVVCECAAGFIRNTAGECASDCGNGQRVPGEQCDDENQDPGDGCDENCRVEPGASCRDGEGGLSICQLDGCGDGRVDLLFEECDDMGTTLSEPDGCRAHCIAAFCGDEIVDSDEECDDGLMEPAGSMDTSFNDDFTPGACRSDCTRARCGDGMLDDDELCDPGAPGGPALDESMCTTECEGFPQPEPDAGTPPPADAGAMEDAGEPDAAEEEASSPGPSGGADCAAGGSPSLAWPLFLMLLWRRRVVR